MQGGAGDLWQRAPPCLKPFADPVVWFLAMQPQCHHPWTLRRLGAARFGEERFDCSFEFRDGLLRDVPDDS
jgi:hypothetical protein